MLPLVQFVLVALSAGISLLLLVYFFYYPKPPSCPITGPNKHETSVSNSKRQTNTNVGVSRKLFSWSDNPSLITDAVETGWSRFAFTDYISSFSVRSKRFSLASCTDVTGGKDDVVEISWDVYHGSGDFMQKIRLNTGLNKIVKSTSLTMSAASVIRGALPLPGPTLGNSSPFPQEAYFEITILSNYESENGIEVNGKRRLNNIGEGENIKLIQENVVVNVKGVHGHFEELKRSSSAKDLGEGKIEASIMLSVGLTSGGSLPARLPGSYPGSVGFNSDGSIFLNGLKLAIHSEIERWEEPEKVIGCGYNPSQKKVFFTLDSKLVHEINCKEEEYGTPLYPTIAANNDVSVLVNFGQSTFKYEPANLQRTQNPCFIGPMANSSGYEDSKELFSMGLIDSQWFDQPIIDVNKGKIKDYDDASDADVFEIVIESNRLQKTPNNM